MAIAQTTITATGLKAENAYKRVEQVQIENKTKLFFVLKSYAGSPSEFQAFDTNGFECSYDMSVGNPYIQAYEHLKTLPEFADAVDC